ncbi:MAG: sugar kinase [Planctomycetota bacterium]|nr:sugar kinase [Planctomycetota bacterium]
MTVPKKVLLFGELLARYTTPGHERFVQAQQLHVTFTGGEANAGLVLADLGHEAHVLSAVPDHAIGQACINYMRRFGLHTEHVLRRAASRLGILYVELGAAHRASQVIYDRKDSAFARLVRGDIDWATVLQGMDWLHFTGTAPALSTELAQLTIEGCRVAKSLGVPVRCDISYRSALWSLEEASRVMQEIVPMLDVLIVNEEHARQLLDVQTQESLGADLFSINRYHAPMEQLAQRYNLSHVVFTVRSGDTSDETNIASAIWNRGTSVISRRYDIRVVDRIGAGDAFSGALIAGLLEGKSHSELIEFATAASCLKHSVPGDFGHCTRAEITALESGRSAGRVAR